MAEKKLDLLHNPKDTDSSLQKFSDCNELLVTSTKTEFNLIEPMKFLQGCLINFKKNVNDLFDEIINKKENIDLLLNKAKKCMKNIVEDIKIEF